MGPVSRSTWFARPPTFSKPGAVFRYAGPYDLQTIHRTRKFGIPSVSHEFLSTFLLPSSRLHRSACSNYDWEKLLSVGTNEEKKKNRAFYARIIYFDVIVHGTNFFPQTPLIHTHTIPSPRPPFRYIKKKTASSLHYRDCIYCTREGRNPEKIVRFFKKRLTPPPP